MSSDYTDEDISKLLKERKPLTEDFRSNTRLKSKRGHKEWDLAVTGVNGNQFQLILRQSDYNTMDFSIILGHLPADSNQVFRLRRYNGKSHEHTNKIEDITFYGFHIHTATQRYQELGMKEDAYAKPTDRYFDLNSAIDCMLKDCGFEVPQNPQRNWVEEIE